MNYHNNIIYLLISNKNKTQILINKNMHARLGFSFFHLVFLKKKEIKKKKNKMKCLEGNVLKKLIFIKCELV
jgi:hypothetical protein